MPDPLKMPRAPAPRNPPGDLVPVLVPRRAVPFVQAALSLVDLARPEAVGTDDDLLPLAEAARVAATAARVVADAVRAGELPAFGRQRDRAVKRGDLRRWIESRRVTHEGADDVDVERRMRRLAANDGASR